MIPEAIVHPLVLLGLACALAVLVLAGRQLTRALSLLPALAWTPLASRWLAPRPVPQVDSRGPLCP